MGILTLLRWRVGPKDFSWICIKDDGGLLLNGFWWISASIRWIQQYELIPQPTAGGKQELAIGLAVHMLIPRNCTIQTVHKLILLTSLSLAQRCWSILGVLCSMAQMQSKKTSSKRRRYNAWKRDLTRKMREKDNSIEINWSHFIFSNFPSHCISSSFVAPLQNVFRIYDGIHPHQQQLSAGPIFQGKRMANSRAHLKKMGEDSQALKCTEMI